MEVYTELIDREDKNNAIRPLFKENTAKAATIPMTLSTTYVAKNWFGMVLWKYTLWVNYEVNGYKVVDFDLPFGKPYTSLWTLESEAFNAGYRSDGKTVRATANIKMRYGLWEFTTIQRVSLYCVVDIYANGTFNVSWREL